jgi:hypothetical protein
LTAFERDDVSVIAGAGERLEGWIDVLCATAIEKI